MATHDKTVIPNAHQKSEEEYSPGIKGDECRQNWCIVIVHELVRIRRDLKGALQRNAVWAPIINCFDVSKRRHASPAIEVVVMLVAETDWVWFMSIDLKGVDDAAVIVQDHVDAPNLFWMDTHKVALPTNQSRHQGDRFLGGFINESKTGR